MKKIMKYFGSAVLMVLAFTACSPDDFSGANQDAIPTIDELNVNVDVDQTTNMVTFSINNPGCYPIWDIKITPEVKTTDNGFTKFIPTAGVYEYTVKLGNRNGESQGEYNGTFKVDETRFDFTPYMTALTTDDEGNQKSWRIYAAKDKHMGCSPLYGDGVEWWAAAPNEKEGEAIYDDFISFAADGTYTYDPGQDGLIFCNNAYKVFTDIGNTGDYHWPVRTKTTSFGFTIVNGDPAIALESGSYFPYMSSNSFAQTPVFRIVNADKFLKDGKILELVADDPANPTQPISWKYILIYGEDEAMEENFDIETVDWTDVYSADNLFKAWNQTLPTYVTVWSRGWDEGDGHGSWDDWEVGHPDVTFADGVYTTVWPRYVPNWEYWHGQLALKSDVTLPKGDRFDFTITFESDADIDGMLVKVQADPELPDNDLFEIKDVAIKAGEPTKIQIGNVKANEEYANAQLLIAPKGVSAGTTITISEIILQPHAEKEIENTYITPFD